MMGMFRKSCTSPYAAQASAPNPAVFEIKDESVYDEGGIAGRKLLILAVHYPHAVNFEGKKILVYEGFTSSKALLKELNNILDPHFAANTVSPIARFAPTTNGWVLANLFCKALVGK